MSDLICRPAELCRAHSHLKGELRVSECMRLLEHLADVHHQYGLSLPSVLEPIAWELDASVKSRHGQEQYWFDLKLRFSLPLICEHCLSALVFSKSLAFTYRFVADEETAEREHAEVEEELLVMAETLDLGSLIEDEVLMALVWAPHHETCQPGWKQETALDETKANPFAVLAQLKSSKGKKHG